MSYLSSPKQTDTKNPSYLKTTLPCPKKPKVGHTDFYNTKTNKWEQKPTEEFLKQQQSINTHFASNALSIQHLFNNDVTTSANAVTAERFSNSDAHVFTWADDDSASSNHSYSIFKEICPNTFSQNYNTNTFTGMFSDDESD